MIINNYDNSLPENKETDVTFISRESPQLFIREFPTVINYNDKLVVPYFVTDAQMGRYYANADENREVIPMCPAHTFTAILVMDPYTDNEIEYKQTTYNGEQSFEIGPFDSDFVGQHTFSLRCIQENGVGSASQDFFILVKDPNRQITTIDLTQINSFSSEYAINSFDPEESNTVTNGSTKYNRVFIRKWGYNSVDNSYNWYPITTVVKETPLARYSVHTNKVNGKIKEITIDVSAGNNAMNYQSGNYYIWNTAKWSKCIRQNKPLGTPDDEWVAYSDTKYSIVGSYTLTTVCYDELNEEHKLVDFLDKQPAGKIISEGNKTLPDYAVKAAIKNRIALTRLMEAARAYATNYNQEVVLKLPKMPIVIDRHVLTSGNTYNWIGDFSTELDMSKEIVHPDYVVRPTNESAALNNYLYVNTGSIKFPNNFTLDLNGSTIYCLQSSDIQGDGGAWMVSIGGCFNTHLINGRVYGPYKHCLYRNNNGFPEGLSVIAIANSNFSTVENVDIAYSVGYDCWVAGYGVAVNTSYEGDVKYPFANNGYLNYDGDKVFSTSNDPYDGYYMKVRNSVPISQSTRVCCNKERLTDIKKTLMHIATNAAGEGVAVSPASKEIFIHMYENTEPKTKYYKTTFNKLKYLGTRKIYDDGIFFAPDNVYTYFLTKIGESASTSNNFLNRLNYDNHSVKFVYPKAVSIGCGFKNCRIYNERSCIYNCSQNTQGFGKNILTWNVACERSVQDGGFSNQLQYIDFENGANTNCNFVCSNMENLYGGRGAKVHRSFNLIVDNCKNVNFLLHKGTYGSYINKYWSEGISFIQGFITPNRYDEATNVVTNRITIGKGDTGSVGDNYFRGYVLLEYSTFNNVNNGLVVGTQSGGKDENGVVHQPIYETSWLPNPDYTKRLFTNKCFKYE